MSGYQAKACRSAVGQDRTCAASRPQAALKRDLPARIGRGKNIVEIAMPGVRRRIVALTPKNAPT
jgi:hypothetical protein